MFLLLLFGLVIILVRLFKLTPDHFTEYYKQKKSAISKEFKNEPASETFTEEEIEALIQKEEKQVVVDTYTHKKDIPVLTTETPNNDFEVTAPVQEEVEPENLKMEVEKIVEETEGTDYPNLMYVHGQIPDEPPKKSFEVKDAENEDSENDEYDVDDYNDMDFDENWN